MGKKTEETKQNTVEQDAQASEGENAATVSNKAAEASEEKAGEKSSKADITQTPEFQAALESIERRFQSVKDKETKGLRERLDQLERERQAEKQAREAVERQTQEEKQIDAIYHGLIEEGVTEEQAAGWRDKAKQTSRDIVKRAMEHNEAVKKHEADYSAKTAELSGKTLKLAIADVVEEAEKQGKVFSHSDAKKIAEDSEGNPKLIQFMVKNAPIVEEEEGEEEEHEIKRPSGSYSSVPRGPDLDNLSSRDLLKRAYSKKK